MIRNITFLFLILFTMTGTGCGFFVAGAVSGAGIFSYMDGELTRLYQADFSTTIKACSNALKANSLTIKNEKLEGLSAQINAEYYNGKPVTVKIMRASTNISKVAVRSGIIGVWDKDFSEQVHVSIEQHIQQ